MWKINLKNMTERQRRAWERYHYGWRLKKIAIHLGIKPNSVSELLVRATRGAGLPRVRYVRMIKTKPRHTRALSLSDVKY